MSERETRIQSFEEFWPYYLGEHKSPVCRGLHYVGTSMAIGTVAAAAVTLNPAWLLATPIVGYGPPWIGHFFVEKNRPATFKYPAWSLRADFKMLGLAVRGKMGAEMRKYYGSTHPAKNAPRVDVAPEVHVNGTNGTAAAVARSATA